MQTKRQRLENEIQIKYKNNIFIKIFEDKSNVLRLYKDLHPEDKEVIEDNIQIVTLDKSINKSAYNDLGFIIKDTMIILVEAQSTLPANIAIRLLIYYAETLTNYIVDNKINLYSKTKKNIPTPEFYVIYTGDDKTDNYIEKLSNHYKEPLNKKIDLEVQVLVKPKENTIADDYINLCKHMDICVKEMGFKKEAILKAIAICKDNNILYKYLEKVKGELEGMLYVLTDEYRKEMQELEYQQELEKEKEIIYKLGEEKGYQLGEQDLLNKLKNDPSLLKTYGLI